MSSPDPQHPDGPDRLPPMPLDLTKPTSAPADGAAAKAAPPGWPPADQPAFPRVGRGCTCAPTTPQAVQPAGATQSAPKASRLSPVAAAILGVVATVIVLAISGSFSDDSVTTPSSAPSPVRSSKAPALAATPPKTPTPSTTASSSTIDAKVAKAAAEGLYASNVGRQAPSLQGVPPADLADEGYSICKLLRSGQSVKDVVARVRLGFEPAEAGAMVGAAPVLCPEQTDKVAASVVTLG